LEIDLTLHTCLLTENCLALPSLLDELLAAYQAMYPFGYPLAGPLNVNAPLYVLCCGISVRNAFEATIEAGTILALIIQGASKYSHLNGRNIQNNDTFLGK